MKNIKKTTLLILFSVLFLFTSKSTEASHMMGGDITYKCIDSFKFEVTLKWYRDCRGIPLTSAGLITVRCSNGGSQNVTLSLIKIREITPLCTSEAARCTPVNGYGGEGAEEHTYRGVLNFNVSPLSALKNCSGKIIIGATISARNGAITTGAANQNLYIDAELVLKNAPCNSSPTLSSIPIIFLCCNQPLFDNIGAVDLVDNDSLSYSWGKPRSAITSNVGYGGKWSYDYAFSVYDPRNPIEPYNPIPSNNPPIGIYLNPVNGDIVFTPINCTEVTVAVINVTEWRKDTAGVYQIIARTQRDLQFIVKSCPENNPPTISGPYSYSICEGEELCFDIVTGDSTFIPPPPALPEPDTVQLSWNEGISGASFSILDTNARLKTGRFCWTPPSGSASNKPYSFTAKIKDDACPINSISYKSFSILVKSGNLINFGKDTAICGGSITLSSIATGNNSWNTGDTSSSITVSTSGLYIVTNSEFCNSTDSIYVTVNKAPNLFLGSDTSLCGDSLLLSAGSYDTYLWSDLSVSSSFVVNASGQYYLEVTDTNGCTANDSIRVNLNTNYNTPFLNKIGNTIVSNRSGIHTWFRDGIIISGVLDSFIAIPGVGTYSAISIDSNGCISDTSNLISKTLGLSSQLSLNLTVYPNPTDGQFTIDCQNLGPIKRISLIDSQGKKLLTSQHSDGNLVLIDFKSCSEILFLEIHTDTGVYRQKIICIQPL